MKKIILTIGFISFLFLGLTAQDWGSMVNESNQNFYQIQRDFNSYWQGKDISEKGKGWKQYKRWENFWETRVDSNGNFPSTNVYLPELNRKNISKSNAVANWTSMGPVRVPSNGGAGRVNCVAFHPNDIHTLYVGAPSGGFWVSYNDGRDWTVTNDNLLSIGVSDIIVHPNNPDTIYIATGDGDAGDTYSMGLMKSYDAGLTWQATGFIHQVQQTIKMTKIAFYPGAPDTIFAATSQGLYKSKDNGATWAQTKSANIKDFEFHPSNPLIIYCSTANRIYKSTDGGDSFSTMQFNESTSRLSIAVSKAAPDYLYILAGNTSNGFLGLFVSTDTAKTFTQRSNSPNLLGWASDGSDAGGQAWYDLTIAVSPVDSNLIYTGGVNIWRSTNGGYNWGIAAHWTGDNAPDVHADHHELEFSIHDSTYLYTCNDGGIQISMDNGYAWYDLSDNLSIAQIYRMAQSTTDPNHVLTGWQDNGTNMLSNQTWRRVLGGDGMNCIIDYSNNDIMYGALYYGRIYRTVDGGSNWDKITDAISETGAWVTPYVQDPIEPNTLYVGMKNIWKTTNKGITWSNISSGRFITANLSYISVSESDNDVIYCGQSQYRIYKTTDGGTTWTDISHNFSGSVTSLCIHPTNPDKIWVSLSNYDADNNVWTSDDGGLTWVNMSTALPNIPANTLVFDKRSTSVNALYVGTDNGVYYIDDTYTDWQSFNDSLPNVIVNELEIYYPTKKLRAATYGRGVWESDLNASSSIEDNIESSNNLKIYPNPANNIVNVSIDEQILENINISVFNGLGQEVINTNTNPKSNTIQLDINDLKTGVYYIKFVYDNTEYNSNFVVKK